MKLSFGKNWYDVATPEHIRRVKKTECLIVCHRKKLKAIQHPAFPSSG
jgi:hypothetical protein